MTSLACLLRPSAWIVLLVGVAAPPAPSGAAGEALLAPGAADAIFTKAAQQAVAMHGDQVAHSREDFVQQAAALKLAVLQGASAPGKSLGGLFEAAAVAAGEVQLLTRLVREHLEQQGAMLLALLPDDAVVPDAFLPGRDDALDRAVARMERTVVRALGRIERSGDKAAAALQKEHGIESALRVLPPRLSSPATAPGEAPAPARVPLAVDVLFTAALPDSDVGLVCAAGSADFENGGEVDVLVQGPDGVLAELSDVAVGSPLGPGPERDRWRAVVPVAEGGALPGGSYRVSVTQRGVTATGEIGVP